VLDLAIVIVNYNVRELLRRCLESVYASEGMLRLGVCVVDNASADGSAQMVREWFPQVKLIANSENLGYPAANNQGLIRLGMQAEDPDTRPRYGLLLNPDTELPSDALATLLAYMDSHQAIGVLGPKLVMPDGRLDLACRRAFPSPEVAFYRMAGLSRLFPRSERFGRYNMTFLDENEPAEVDSVVGAFMLVRREAIDQVGLMDERFWMYGEDLDWAKRMKDVGWRVLYYPEVEVLHVKRASSSQSRRAQREFYRAMLIFYYKHYHGQTGRLLHWLILTGIMIKAGGSILPFLRMGPAILDGEGTQ
jgi:N-acetylglucosaminyl-diphospho-decaprenol L-rhamnosyltransferase